MEKDVKIMMRIINLHLWTNWSDPTYEVCTEAYEGAMKVRNHKWNKSIKRKDFEKAIKILLKWQEQIKKDGLEYSYN